MTLLLALACSSGGDTAPAGPRTSDHLVEFASPPSNACEDGELVLQAVFAEEVPRVEAEVRDGSGAFELHDVPFAGMDEETGELFVYERSLEMEADEAGTGTSTFSCDDVPYAGWRVYDDEGALMACYFGDFVVQEYDTTGCPE